MLLGAGEILQLDRVVAAIDLRRQQRAEHGIAIERRQAAPDHVGTGVDQRGEAAIADQAEVQRGCTQTDSPCVMPSHARTSATSRRLWRALLGSRAPTNTLRPPCALTTSKPCSSVRSSPANTGMRPRNGGSSRKAAIALPLLVPAGRSSTTWSPCCRW